MALQVDQPSLCGLPDLALVEVFATLAAADPHSFAALARACKRFAGLAKHPDILVTSQYQVWILDLTRFNPYTRNLIIQSQRLTEADYDRLVATEGEPYVANHPYKAHIVTRVRPAHVPSPPIGPQSRDQLTYTYAESVDVHVPQSHAKVRSAVFDLSLSRPWEKTPLLNITRLVWRGLPMSPVLLYDLLTNSKKLVSIEMDEPFAIAALPFKLLRHGSECTSVRELTLHLANKTANLTSWFRHLLEDAPNLSNVVLIGGTEEESPVQPSIDHALWVLLLTHPSLPDLRLSNIYVEPAADRDGPLATSVSPLRSLAVTASPLGWPNIPPGLNFPELKALVCSSDRRHTGDPNLTTFFRVLLPAAPNLRLFRCTHASRIPLDQLSRLGPFPSVWTVVCDVSSEQLAQVFPNATIL